MKLLKQFFSYKAGFFSGSIYERTDDLKFLKPVIQNNSVIDIGSNIGIVAYEIGKFKPKKIDLLERSSKCLNLSKSLLDSVNFPVSFVKVNLSKSKIINKYINLRKVDKTYDVILMLAIYQHMKKQSSANIFKENIKSIFLMAKKYIVFRVPLKLKHEIYDICSENGFELFFEKPAKVNRGPLIVFKRITK